MAKSQNDRATIDLVINGKQAQTSLKDVSLAATNARSAMNKMKETDPGYKDRLKELHALLAAQRQMSANINQTTTAWGRFKANAASTATGLLGGNLIGAGFSAAVNAIPALIGKYREFDAASKDLSAVTGATGADLDYLNKTAAKTGPTFGKSGAEMLEAYKLMASAKPELLSNKELLTQTTEAAITLAQAGRIDLAQATTVTAESLNQFGESADQANRFINVIAAGAKEGSAEIADMGAALKNSGTVAKAQGVSFEQTNAVLQSLSTIALKGGEAGTQFRNVLLTLGSGANDTNPKVVGLEKALENLGKKNLSTAEMTKLFGKENITAAQHIIAHRNEIGELTKKVTGTQEAFTQAETNNQSLDHQLEIFWARVNGLAVLLGTKLVPIFTKVVEAGIGLVNLFTGGLTPAADAATNAFEEQKGKVQDLTKNLSPLLSRHDELKKKTILTKDEQAELRKIIDQVATAVPSAATGFDKYGNALDINTGKARDFIEMQKEMLKYTNKKAIDETDKEIADTSFQRDLALSKLNSGFVSERDPTSMGGGYRNRAMTKAEFDEAKKEVTKRNNELAALEKRKAGFTGDYLTVPEPGTAPTTPKETPTGGGKTGLTDEQKRKAKEQLDANHEAILRIQKMKIDAIRDDRARELAQAQYEADRAKEQVRKSVESEKYKAQEIKAISEKLSADKAQIESKYELDRLKDIRGQFEKELKLEYQLELTGIEERIGLGAITKEQGKIEELEAEQTFLMAKDLLYDQHYEELMNAAWGNDAQMKQIAQDLATSTLAIDQAQLDKEGELSMARKALKQSEFEHEKELAEKRKQFAQEENQFKKQMLSQAAGILMNDWTATLDNYKTFWQEATVLQKVALVAQKAYAIAEIAINLSRQISAINTAAAIADALIPFSGEVIRAKGLIMAIGSAAVQTAAVLSQGTQTPTFAKGGFTGSGDTHPGVMGPSGYVEFPTLFQMGNRRFIAGEKGREFVISNQSLQNPMVANFARIMDVAQKTGNYGMLMSGASGGQQPASGAAPQLALPAGGGITPEMMMLLIRETQANRQAIADLAKRPIMNNYRLQEEFEANVQQIRTETSLKSTT